MSYVYLGYGTTNSDGVAHLDHDANGDKIQHSYTGVGAGEIDVVASLDNPVSSGSIVSEPYEVLDTSFYQNSASATWGKSNNVSFSDGVASNSSSSAGYLAPSLSGTTVDTKKWDTDLMIEFDFIKGTNSIQIQLNDGTNNIARYLTTSCNVKIQV